MAAETHYDVLGIEADAPHRQVLKAFLALARRYHPSLNPYPAACARFGRIKAAYDELWDYQARRRYNDRMGLPYPPPPPERRWAPSSDFDPDRAEEESREESSLAETVAALLGWWVD